MVHRSLKPAVWQRLGSEMGDVARTGQRYTLLGALDENGKFLAAKRFTLYHYAHVYPRTHPPLHLYSLSSSRH